MALRPVAILAQVSAVTRAALFFRTCVPMKLGVLLCAVGLCASAPTSEVNACTAARTFDVALRLRSLCFPARWWRHVWSTTQMLATSLVLCALFFFRLASYGAAVPITPVTVAAWYILLCGHASCLPHCLLALWSIHAAFSQVHCYGCKFISATIVFALVYNQVTNHVLVLWTYASFVWPTFPPKRLEPTEQLQCDPDEVCAEAAAKREQRFRNYVNGCRFCETCGKVRSGAFGHLKNSPDHMLRQAGLTQDEKAAQRKVWEENQTNNAQKQSQRLQQELHLHDAHWQPASVVQAETAPGDNLMTFGKYKRKLTVNQVLKLHRDYMVYCVMVNNKEMTALLKDLGIYEQFVPEAEEMRLQKAMKVLRDDENRVLHPDLKRFKKLEREDALQVLQGAHSAEEVLVEATTTQERARVNQDLAPLPRKRVQKPRRRKSKAVIQFKRCRRCGSIKHNHTTCPLVLKEIERQTDEQQEMAKQARTARALLRARERLKYTSIHQHSETYDKRPTKKARAVVSRSFLEHARASPYALTAIIIESELLCNLCGVKCPNPRCAEGKGFGDPKLGSFHGQTTGLAQDISRDSVHYRCGFCRERIMVNEGSALFNSRAIGHQGTTYALLCFQNCVIGISQTHTAIQLKCNENVVRAHYHKALRIMADDAIRRQSEIVYGQRGALTTDVEIDEHSFFHWSHTVGEVTTHCWYPWVGVVERGNLESLSLFPMGVTHSDDTKPPPIGTEFWRPLAATLFSASANIIQMTDGALEYPRFRQM